MRGAHRGVWCSKSTPLIEAELFAAESKRPAQNGRALSCAANHARKIQGITASQNLPDARNRAPVTPVSLHISDVSAQRKVWGVKRGQETIGVLSPFALAGGHRRLRRQTAAFPPVNTGTPGRRRRPLCTLTLSVNLASSGAPLYRRKVYRQLTEKNFYLSFGRRMFRMIATNAAGTIPEPPKISWIACGACARMDMFAPMP